jgi:hypothetical protein
MDEDDGSDENENLDMNALNFPGKNWTAKEYSNARSINQYDLDRDTIVLFFYTLRYNKMPSLVIWLRKQC